MATKLTVEHGALVADAGASPAVAANTHGHRIIDSVAVFVDTGPLFS